MDLQSFLAVLASARQPLEAWVKPRNSSMRANARAGGPISERDKELLERYGCLSGTNSPFCRQLAHGKPPRTRAQRRQRQSPRASDHETCACAWRPITGPKKRK